MMMTIEYQNTSSFAFLVLFRHIVVFTPLELQNSKKKTENKLNSGSCSQTTAVLL